MSLCEGFALQWTWYWLYACLFRKWHPSYYNLVQTVVSPCTEKFSLWVTIVLLIS